MASMPTYHVSKGPFGYLDDLFGDPGSKVFDDALAALEGEESTETLRGAARARERRRGEGLSRADADHFSRDWLEHWWQEYAPADTLRAGIREAITHAHRVQKPMEFLWVCADEQAFHVYFTESPQQVTVVVFTPLPDEGHSHDRLSTPEPIWVVKLRDEYDDAYPSLGDRGAISAPVPVAQVTSGPPSLREQTIIKQQLFYT